MFDNVVWENDRVLIGELIFHLDPGSKGVKVADGNHFDLLKPKRMMDQYRWFWGSRPPFRAQRILEIGIWNGGSIPFWFECFQPEKHVAIDLQNERENRSFQDYLASRRLEERIKTYWKTDQADAVKLRAIVQGECNGVLDLVIDDGSHRYEQTKISFQTLFPLVRPGGLYIIEDWSWGCWPSLPLDFLPLGTELPKLLFQLVEATGSTVRSLGRMGNTEVFRPLIASMTVFADFVVLERGDADAAQLPEFELEQYITRRPTS